MLHISKRTLARFAVVLGVFALAVPVFASLDYVQEAQAEQEQEQVSTDYAMPYMDGTTLVIPGGTVHTNSIKTILASGQEITQIQFLASYSCGNTTITNENKDYEGLFSGLTKLTSIKWEMSNSEGVIFDGSNVSLRNLFAYDTALESIDANFIYADNVADVSGMFRHCSSLTYLGLSHWSCSYMSNFSLMCYMCTSLQTLSLNSFDDYFVSDVTDMFRGCDLQTVTMDNGHGSDKIASAIEGTFNVYSLGGDLLASNSTVASYLASVQGWGTFTFKK